MSEHPVGYLTGKPYLDFHPTLGAFPIEVVLEETTETVTKGILKAPDSFWMQAIEDRAGIRATQLSLGADPSVGPGFSAFDFAVSRYIFDHYKALRYWSAQLYFPSPDSKKGTAQELVPFVTKGDDYHLSDAREGNAVDYASASLFPSLEIAHYYKTKRYREPFFPAFINDRIAKRRLQKYEEAIETLDIPIITWGRSDYDYGWILHFSSDEVKNALLFAKWNDSEAIAQLVDFLADPEATRAMKTLIEESKVSSLDTYTTVALTSSSHQLIEAWNDYRELISPNTPIEVQRRLEQELKKTLSIT